MKKNVVKLIAFCLICAVLGGCAGTSGEGNTADPTKAADGATVSTQLGGYVEKTLSADGYTSLTSITTDDNGDLLAIAKNSDDVWTLLRWKNGETSPTATALDIEGASAQLSIAPDGGIAVFATKPMDMSGMGGANQMIAGGPEGTQNNPGRIEGEGEPKEAESEPDGEAPKEDSEQAEDDGVPKEVFDEGESAEGSAQEDPSTQNAGEGGVLQRGQGDRSQPGDVMTFRNESIVYWLNADGSIAGEMDFSMSNDMATSFAALNDGELLVASARGGISRYDADGNSVGGYAGNASSFVVRGDKLYVLEGMSGSLTIYDVESGAELSSVADLGSDSMGSILTVGPDGGIYLVSSTGIGLVDENAGTVSPVMDAVNYSINDPTLSITGASAGLDGTIVISASESGSRGGTNGRGMMATSVVQFAGGGAVSFGDGESGANVVLYAYEWSPELDLSNMKNLRVAGLRDSQLVRKAITEFQRAHPDVRISLETYLGMNDRSETSADYIRAINAELLAGNGADVLILDGLPVESYIKKGVLLDLTEALADISILPGIRQGSIASDGKLYSIPAAFSFRTLWGHKDVISQIDSLTSLADYANSLSGEDLALSARTAESLLGLFFDANKHLFYDDSGVLRFDTPEFEEFLEAMYGLYAEPDSSSANNNPFGGGGNARGGMDMNEMLQMANGVVKLLPTEVSRIDGLNMAYSIAGAENSDWMGVPNLEGDGYGYVPSAMAGVNSRSFYTDLAVEFVKTLYSAEVQAFATLPTTPDALDELVATAKEAETSMMMRVVNGPAIETTSIDDAILDDIRAYCDRLNVPAISDETLNAFILEETAKFFEGSRSASETASSLQQRVAAYLAE